MEKAGAAPSALRPAVLILISERYRYRRSVPQANHANSSLLGWASESYIASQRVLLEEIITISTEHGKSKERESSVLLTSKGVLTAEPSWSCSLPPIQII